MARFIRVLALGIDPGVELPQPFDRQFFPIAITNDFCLLLGGCATLCYRIDLAFRTAGGRSVAAAIGTGHSRKCAGSFGILLSL